MASENRLEYCWRIGGDVYMRTDKPCPECGTPDTHTPKSELRAKITELHEAIEFQNTTLGDKQNRIDGAIVVLDEMDPCWCDDDVPDCWACRVRRKLEGR